MSNSDGSQALKNKYHNYSVLECSVRNEDGVVLVTALMMLVVLTLMGVAAMMVRNTEQSITANSEVFQHNFYAAEAVTLEGANTLENLTDAVLNTPGSYPGWLKLESAGVDLEDSTNWPSGSIIPRNTSLTGAAVNITPGGYASIPAGTGDRIWSAAIDRGISPGGSVTYASGSGGTTKLERVFDVYGMYDVKSGAGKSYHGKMMLVVGYKKQVSSP